MFSCLAHLISCESRHSLCLRLPSACERGRVWSSLFSILLLRDPIWHLSVSASPMLPPEPHGPSSSFLIRHALSCLWTLAQAVPSAWNTLPYTRLHLPNFYLSLTSLLVLWNPAFPDVPRLGRVPLPCLPPLIVPITLVITLIVTVVPCLRLH